MGRKVLWRAIAGTLSEEIAAGQYHPGDRLPTEADLAARFGVNRHTVRQALADLVQRGIVRTRRGAGTFVASKPTDYPLSRRTRFHQNVLASGRSPSRRFTRSETRAADPREAEALALEPGALVHVVEGISLIDGQPVAVFRSVFPAGPLPGLCEEIAARQSVTLALAACGVADYTRSATRITARIARGTLALALELAEGAPLLRSDAVNVDGAGQPVEYGRTWFAGDRITLTLAPDS
ncbi:phosphonate metabolism transcriptional regulator PhnF [Falsigemmobacter faecalis]|uniref:Phosphonate metabolism transcriptional regulator PhnF n=1 Tax=Falsigemmobacter faecalis TaxID=2488730 RepID=A0A3P3DQY2_9RHOB|nr:phosphonate metabolism transcriptional regulator PhnF [Falsigemmobacter faecalis]RRH76625.1 phosphonate metabolism transcriptional regulator PhnF [Falsigemmobacter faecalis]